MDPKILREAALAYQAVYDEELRQEIEEQQDFENWVNSLVEEGYDLSEYTWEEMYEEYLNEMGQTRTTGQNPSVFTVKTTPGAGSASGQGGRRGSGSNPSVPRSGPAKPTPSSTQSRFAGARDAAVSRARQIQGSPVVGSRPSGGSSTPAARTSGGSSTPVARPTSTAAARPAASAPTAKPTSTASTPVKPAPGTKAAGPESIKPKTPNPLMQKTFGYQTGKAPDQVAKSPSPSPAATPTPPKRPMGSVKPGSLVSGFDMFDVVKGYLIDEGYAETEQAAVAIMSNMSEYWRNDIIEAVVLAQKAGQEGKLDKSTGKFTAGKWSSEEGSRYKSQQSKSSPAAPAKSPQPKSPGYSGQSSVRGNIQKLKDAGELEDLQARRNKRWAANELKPGVGGERSLSDVEADTMRAQGKDFGVDPKATERSIKAITDRRRQAAGLK